MNLKLVLLLSIAMLVILMLSVQAKKVAKRSKYRKVQNLLNPSFVKITAKNRKKVTEQQNNIRSKVALGRFTNGLSGDTLPRASNMIKILWSKTLEAKAKLIAKTCVLTPTQGLNQIVLDGPIDAGPALKNATLIWSKELSTTSGLDTLTYTAPAVNTTSYNDFTQMVWAKTKLFGCGIGYCSNMTGKNDTDTFVVCKYKGVGNNEGAKIYKKGKPVSKCPKNTHKAPTKGYCKQNRKTKAGYLAVGA